MSDFPTTIQTKRLILRQPCEEMTQALLNYRPLRIPEVDDSRDCCRSYTAFANKEELSRYLEEYGPWGRQPIAYYYSTPNIPKKILGKISFFFGRESLAELTWKADATAPRKGYVTEAARAVIQTIGEPIVLARIAHFNKPSQALAKRLGGVCGKRLRGYDCHVWRISSNSTIQNQDAEVSL